MLRGIYASATGMIAEARRLDVITNNVANAATTGYKPDAVRARPFADVLVQRLDDRDGTGRIAPPAPVGRLGMGVQTPETVTVLADGPLRFTGRALDLALQGDGFFTVEDARGQRFYTRDGAFRLDAEGYLVTASGHRVLLESGQPVAAGGAGAGRRPGGEEAIQVDSDGTVRAGGEALGRLAIVSSQEVPGLRKVGANLWAQGEGSVLLARVARSEPAGGAPAGGARPWTLLVGYLEGSGVEPVLEMADLIATMRAYEANQRALRMQDEALGRAANDVGRVG
ncbi:flagellar hook-basal body protein [Caldinitratiruptor microaerophilus]|uniref:Flagellar basal-body rod protein FlgF n=1 Tax=Caldinitratiruptor microaerophilus TaxID=671077 RepID=A0AA35CNM8_9FIRM|nr:flagellar hook-basal body protein [Caldinitratiruptor microaerophilus]BDG61753.1 flagellar basal-body rod protein FlgF [Caldinitratiruptor microaerophilus]